MLAKTNSCAVIGLDGEIVEVEVDISNGLPRFNIVGLPDTAVTEAKERVRAAIKNSGLHFPATHTTLRRSSLSIPVLSCQIPLSRWLAGPKDSARTR